MKPFYILKPIAFNQDQEVFRVNTQTTMSEDARFSPFIELTKKPSEQQNISNHIKYKLITESEEHKTGRLPSSEELFENWIFRSEDNMYYNVEKDIIIIASNKRNFNKFTKHFQVQNSGIDFNKIDVDFKYIVEHRDVYGIDNIWLSDIPDDINISTLSLYGSKVEDSNSYLDMISGGANITNISFYYSMNKDNQIVKVMITKDGGIILYNHLDDSDALILIDYIYQKIILKND